MPFVGSRPSATLMLTKACTAIIVVRPTATNDPKASSALVAIRRPRHAITQKHIRMAVVPMSPSSSPMTE
jgi:hypothetical protein